MRLGIWFARNRSARLPARSDGAGDVQDASPMAAKLSVIAEGEATTDLAEKALPLPSSHGDVIRERAEQIDVTVGVVDGLPVVLADVDHLEPARALDLVAVVGQFAWPGSDGIGRGPFANLVVDLLELLEERVAS